MAAAPDLLVGQQAEEALHLIDPGRRGGREMQLPTWTIGNQRRISLVLWLDVVVHHDMHVEVAGTLRFDAVEELAELSRAVTRRCTCR